MLATPNVPANHEAQPSEEMAAIARPRLPQVLGLSSFTQDVIRMQYPGIGTPNVIPLPTAVIGAQDVPAAQDVQEVQSSQTPIDEVARARRKLEAARPASSQAVLNEMERLGNAA